MAGKASKKAGGTTIKFAGNVDVVVRRFEHTDDTKRARKFEITDEMVEAAVENGSKEKDAKIIGHTIYDYGAEGLKGADSIYVIFSSEPPEDFEDNTVA